VSVWTVKLTNPVELNCSFDPYCDYCTEFPRTPVKLTLLDLELHNFKLKKEGKPVIGHAIDVTFICPKCKSDETFGVALSKEEFEFFEKAKVYSKLRKVRE
jgi:hypothetical protein